MFCQCKNKLIWIIKIWISHNPIVDTETCFNVLNLNLNFFVLNYKRREIFFPEKCVLYLQYGNVG